MATYDLTVGGSGAGRPYDGENRVFTLRKKLDFSETGYTAADVLQLFDIQAGWRVDRIGAHVKTAEGGAATGDLGDGDDPNGYIDALNLNSVGYSASILALTEATPNTITGYSEGRLYPAADTIDLTLDDTVDAAVVVFFVVITDFSDL